MFDNIPFQRCFAVDQRGDNIAIVQFLVVFQNHDVAIDNVRADHRVTSHPQRKGAAIF